MGIPIFIRDDDVLVKSSSGNEIKRFISIHETIKSCGFIHRPGILVLELFSFPEIIDYIKNETLADKMDPQFHGLFHLEYHKFNTDKIIDHINLAQKTFENWFGKRFTRLYAPWGGNSLNLQEACSFCNVQLVDCNKDYYPIEQAVHFSDLSVLKEKEIAIHWWKQGTINRLKRLK